MCVTGKVRHRSMEAACIAMRKLKNAGLKAYRCQKCNGWHLANDKKDWKIQARIDQLLQR